MDLMKMKFRSFIFLSIILNFVFIDLTFSTDQIDTSFGTNGIVITSKGHFDYANSTTLQSDNKIVVTGVINTLASIKIGVIRYTTSGALDTTFNSSGIVTTLIGSQSQGNGVTLQSDGKIIVGGLAVESQTNFAIVRYNTDGSLDTTFNTVGYVTTSIGDGAQVNSVKVQDDGKIVAGGTAVAGQPKFALARYNTDGTLDNTFGTSGIVLTSIDAQAVINKITIQNDGKIVAVGYSQCGPLIQIALARYNTDGTLDNTFGTSGIAKLSINIESVAKSVSLQTDESIVIAGYTKIFSPNQFSQFVVARYTSSGLLDTTFNTTGYIVMLIQDSSAANAVGIQFDGKIIAAGYSLGDDDIQFTLVRYNTDGSLDTTYGTNGIQTTSIDTMNPDARINSIVIQNDNKAVVGGYDGDVQGAHSDIALARYLP